MTELLRIADLTLRFHGAEDTAVSRLNLSVAAGETLAIVGESGSGKTMTALTVARLAPEAALERFEGEVLLDGTEILAADAETLRALRRNRIGVVFQDPAATLNPIMKVGRQIEEALSDRARLPDLLREVGLGTVPDVADRYPHELSGGQQQRIVIAMAIAGDPALLIADEPTTALDVTIQAQILDLFDELKARRGMAMLFISHDFGVVARLADRIVVMRHGEVVEAGPARDVLTAPQSAYTRALLACRPSLDDPPARLATLSGTPDAAGRPEIGGEVLAVRGLDVTYPPRAALGSAFTAAAGIDLTIRRNEAVGLVGESGSGKSSIAKALVGLAPVTSGEILLDGARKPSGATAKEDRRRVQYIFQDSYGSLNPRFTVRQVLREGLDIHGIGAPAERDAAAASLLAEVGLTPAMLERLPSELSGGQRQRVAIARALALAPELLICDEIVSALDVSVQAQILNLLKDLMAERSLAILFISHDLGAVRFIADRVLVMQDGRIVEAGSAGEIVAAPRTPYAAQLVAAARAIELRENGELEDALTREARARPVV